MMIFASLIALVVSLPMNTEPVGNAVGKLSAWGAMKNTGKSWVNKLRGRPSPSYGQIGPVENLAHLPVNPQQANLLPVSESHLVPDQELPGLLRGAVAVREDGPSAIPPPTLRIPFNDRSHPVTAKGLNAEQVAALNELEFTREQIEKVDPARYHEIMQTKLSEEASSVVPPPPPTLKRSKGYNSRLFPVTANGLNDEQAKELAVAGLTNQQIDRVTLARYREIRGIPSPKASELGIDLSGKVSPTLAKSEPVLGPGGGTDPRHLSAPQLPRTSREANLLPVSESRLVTGQELKDALGDIHPAPGNPSSLGAMKKAGTNLMNKLRGRSNPSKAGELGPELAGTGSPKLVKPEQVVKHGIPENSREANLLPVSESRVVTGQELQDAFAGDGQAARNFEGMVQRLDLPEPAPVSMTPWGLYPNEVKQLKQIGYSDILINGMTHHDYQIAMNEHKFMQETRAKVEAWMAKNNFIDENGLQDFVNSEPKALSERELQKAFLEYDKGIHTQELPLGPSQLTEENKAILDSNGPAFIAQGNEDPLAALKNMKAERDRLAAANHPGATR